MTSSVDPPPIVAIDHGSGTKEAQVGFFGAGNDFGAHAEDTFDLILELLTVFRVTSCRGGNETQAVDGMFGNHTGEFPSGHIGAFQRFVGKTRAIFSRMEFVPQSMPATVTDSLLIAFSSYPLVRMNGLFALAHLLINRPACSGRRSDRIRL